MNDKVSDNDRNFVSKAAVSNSKFALNMFLYGGSEIIFIDVAKKKKYTKVFIFSSNHGNLRFRFHNKASFESFEKILASEYSDLRIVYTNGAQALYSSYINIGPSYMNNEVMYIASRIYQDGIADNDEKWNTFYESYYDKYITLLSKYLNENVRFIENLNKRLDAASDSDKLLAMIND